MKNALLFICLFATHGFSADWETKLFDLRKLPHYLNIKSIQSASKDIDFKMVFSDYQWSTCKAYAGYTIERFGEKLAEAQYKDKRFLLNNSFDKLKFNSIIHSDKFTLYLFGAKDLEEPRIKHHWNLYLYNDGLIKLHHHTFFPPMERFGDDKYKDYKEIEEDIDLIVEFYPPAEITTFNPTAAMPSKL